MGRTQPQASRAHGETLALDVFGTLLHSGGLAPVLFSSGVETVRRRVVLLDLARRADVEQLPPASVQLLAAQLRQDGETAEAIRLLRAAQERHPDDPWINHDLAHALHRQAQPQLDEAIRFYTAARAIRPQIGHSLAHALLDRGRREEAAALFRELTRLRPKNARHFNCLGALLDQMGKDAEAEEALRQALQLNPRLYQAWFNLGLLLLRAKRDAEAEKAFSESLRLQPEYARTYTNLGIAITNQGRAKEAEALFRRAIALDPNEVAGRYQLAYSLSKRGGNVEAERLYREAIALSPRFVQAHRELGRLLWSQRRLGEAEPILETSVRLAPNRARGHIDLAFIRLDLGRGESAIAHLHRAVALAPEDTSIRSEAAFAFARTGRHAEAIENYAETLKRTPERYVTIYNMGNSSAAIGDEARAVCCYLRALEVRANYPEAYCNMGHSLVKLGQFEAALAALKRGHEMGTKRGGWPYASAGWIRDCEQLIAIVPRIDLLADASKASASELDLAVRACLYLGRHTAQIQLTEKLTRGQVRYESALGAYLAGSGQSKDSPADEKARATFRKKALQWLTEEINEAQSLLKSNRSKEVVYAQQSLRLIQAQPCWQPGELGVLPEAEREAWRKLLAVAKMAG